MASVRAGGFPGAVSARVHGEKDGRGAGQELFTKCLALPAAGAGPVGRKDPPNRTGEETLGSQSSPTLSPKRQPPPKSLWKADEDLSQWFCAGIKCRGEECCVEKGPFSSVWSRVCFTGNTTDKFIRLCSPRGETEALSTVVWSQEPLLPTSFPLGKFSTRQKCRSRGSQFHDVPSSTRVIALKGQVTRPAARKLPVLFFWVPGIEFRTLHLEGRMETLS